MAKKLSVIHCIVPEVEGLNMAPGNYGSMGMGGWVRAEYLGSRDQLLFSRWSKPYLAAEWTPPFFIKVLVFHGWCKASGGQLLS